MIDSSGDLTFRPLTWDDLELLKRWLSEPHVTRTEWSEHHPEAVEADFGPAIDGEDPTCLWVVVEADRPVGMIQDYVIGDYPEWVDDLSIIDAHLLVGIDYLIGESDAVGRGLGHRMIAAHCDALWSRYQDAPAILTGVLEDNQPSWRALEKAGFSRVWTGVLRSDRASGVVTHLYRLDRHDR